MKINNIIDFNVTDDKDFIDTLISISFEDERDNKYDMTSGFVSIYFKIKDFPYEEDYKPCITFCDGGYSSDENPFAEEEINILTQYAIEEVNKYLK